MSKQPPIPPPRWADRLLGWYCSESVREQVQGDAHELFYWRLAEKGHGSAKRAFVWDAVRLFKWSNIKRKSQYQQLNNITMFKNYFKIGLRNLWKQKMPSIINTVGLSLAVGCCLVAFLFIEFQTVRDDFHEKGDRIYLGTHQAFEDDGVYRFGYLSRAIGERIANDFSGVKNVVSYSVRGVSVELGNRGFSESAAFTDKAIFDTFSLTVLRGNPDDLANPDQVALASETAKRYFGEDEAIGQTIQVQFGEESRYFEVAVVFEELPNNSSLRPELLLNPSWLVQNRDIKNVNSQYFLELEEGVKPEDVIGSLQSLIPVQNGFNLDRKYDSIGLEPLTTMAKNASQIRGGIGSVPPMAPMILLASIGCFMLILATFNYINIATAMAFNRVKEIGVRKVIGSRRSQLIVQFLTENLILCTLAMVAGCLLAAGFFIPKFNGISGSSLTLDILSHTNLQLFLVALLVFLTLASGAYPAFFVSKFKPVKIFRGSEKVGGKRRFTQVLLSVQFILAIITIVGGISAVQNNAFYENRDWGYNQYDKLVVGLSSKYYQAFRSEALKNPNVLDVAGSVNSLNRHWDFREMKVGEIVHRGQYFRGAPNYPEFMEVPLITGRYFDERITSDLSSAILVNETFATTFQIDPSVDASVMIDSVNYQVVGILEDYFYSSFQDGIEPAVFKAEPDSVFNSLTVLVEPGTLSKVRDELEVVWDGLNTEESFTEHFQSEVREREFYDMRGLRNVLVFTASLAVLLASMGLFGLVSLSVSAKFKDFGIKKVLGASTIHLTRELYRKFSLIVGVAILVGSALAVKVIGLLLMTVYGEHKPVSYIPLGFAALLLLITAVFTINMQMRRVRKMNPAETLRME